MQALLELKRRDIETRETASDLYRNLVIEATERELVADDADTVAGVLSAAGKTPEQFTRDVERRREMQALEAVATPLQQLRDAENEAYKVRAALEKKQADAIAKLNARYGREISEASELQWRAKSAAEQAQEARKTLESKFPNSELFRPVNESPEDHRRRRERAVSRATSQLNEAERKLRVAKAQWPNAEHAKLTREIEELGEHLAMVEEWLSELR